MSSIEEILKTDLMLNELEEWSYDLTLSETMRVGPKIAKREVGDFRVITGESNLGQAIVTRLKTRKGELADLGHPNYGSTLYELIGEPNNEETRELVFDAILEALRQEPRIKRVLKIEVSPSKYDLTRVDVELSVIPTDREEALGFTFPVRLEVA